MALLSQEEEVGTGMRSLRAEAIASHQRGMSSCGRGSFLKISMKCLEQPGYHGNSLVVTKRGDCLVCSFLLKAVGWKGRSRSCPSHARPPQKPD